MIQRIQSIFLLLSGACLGGTFALPFADSAQPVPGTLFADSYFSNSDHIGLMVLFGLAALASIAAIFLYNNRPLQKNISWASILLALGAIAFGVFFFMQQADAMGSVAVDEEPGALLPIAALVFDFLAIRSINKDERLVRSADRLR